MKVPDGKMVEARIEYGGTITKVQILGDFFVYPDGMLREIENMLIGTGVNESEEHISMRISELVKSKGITLVGVTPEAIASVLKRAIKNDVEGNKA